MSDAKDCEKGRHVGEPGYIDWGSLQAGQHRFASCHERPLNPDNEEAESAADLVVIPPSRLSRTPSPGLGSRDEVWIEFVTEDLRDGFLAQAVRDRLIVGFRRNEDDPLRAFITLPDRSDERRVQALESCWAVKVL